MVGFIVHSPDQFTYIFSQGKPTIESLPTDIIVLILFQIPDIPSVRSLVRASPIWHHVYLAVRQRILRFHLNQEFESLAIDPAEAITALRSQGLYLRTYREEAIALLDAWRRHQEIAELALTPSIRVDQPRDFEEVIDLLHYCRQLRFFLEDFSINAICPQWMSSTQWNDNLPLRLSQTEQTRFMRAVCRLQIHTNIFGPALKNPYTVSRAADYRNFWQGFCPRDQMEPAYQLFHGAMPTWEYDEIASLVPYFEDKYRAICSEIDADLRKLWELPCPPHLGHPSGTSGISVHGRDREPRPSLEEYLTAPNYPLYVYDISESSSMFDMESQLVIFGPKFLYCVLHMTYTLRRDYILKNYTTGRGGWAFADIDHNYRSRLPFIYPADRHDTHDYKLLWSTLSPTEQPSGVWKRLNLPKLGRDADLSLREALVDRHGRSPSWAWAYAIWDMKRVRMWETPPRHVTPA
ncbi:hypothetical protein N7456_009316 [Penicillium angulare]|uniref:F-box domain-containing protein n=1 Tax=Penicillium angulare TaxID=116970 RepID=A0A9W9F4F3_9EURO|nr:hypothetical protein N7456_009316 [Penicillium angulare]